MKELLEKSIEERIRSLGLRYFDQVGFTSAGRPSTMEYYEKWIAQGHHGAMDYLARHQEKKANPQLLLPGARSWMAFLLTYDTQEPLSVELRDSFRESKQGWIARYARGQDYHSEIQQRHEKLIAELKENFPGEQFLSCVDTRAVLERDVAAHAGLGWIGKNTCLINQDLGSFVFLSEILTTLELYGDKPVMDHCGTCNRCVEACPTGALVAPRQLDARQCISYWTIESKEVPPTSLASKFGYNFFGCDICQDVCPWNQKSRRQRELPLAHESGLVDLVAVAQSSAAALKEKTLSSAMNRAKPEQLKRNAGIVLGNLEGSLWKKFTH